MIALSRGVKIFTVYCLVLLQSMRVTDGRTDGHNYDSQDRASIAMLARYKSYWSFVFKIYEHSQYEASLLLLWHSYASTVTLVF